jgi:TPR repeat protein
MASSSSHNNGIPLSTLLEWYKIRDTFCERNYVLHNIPLALQLAASCNHPDARWLTKVCAGKDVTTRKEAKRVFSALGQNDARALCFAWCSLAEGDREDVASLRRSAELGFAFAQAWMADKTDGEECFKFSQLAAAQGERDGFFQLGCCFRARKNLEKAMENFLRASDLGDVWAMIELGTLIDESDPQRWGWWGRAALLGSSFTFLVNFSEQVELFNSGSGSASVMFAIGRALQGHVHEETMEIFNNKFNFNSFVAPAKQALAFYQLQIKATKDAVNAWTFVAIQFNVVKDVRKLIAQLIWDCREEALFKK